MAALTIPESVQAYFPNNIDPAQLWVNYNSKADSLTIYFTGEPIPSVWDDVDEYIKMAQSWPLTVATTKPTRVATLQVAALAGNA